MADPNKAAAPVVGAPMAIVSPIPAERFEIQRTHEQAPVLVIPNDRQVIKLHDAITSFEHTLDRPYRRKGTFISADIPSLIAWAARNMPNCPWFCSGLDRLKAEWKSPKLSMIAVGNYSDNIDPAWHDFRGRYDFPVSLQWETWAKADGVLMDQADFALFIEDHLYELASVNEGEQLNEAVTRFLEYTGKDGRPGVPASPSAIVMLSRGLKLTAMHKVETRIKVESNEVTLNYTQENQGEGGRPIEVPQMFFIRIPVFHGTPEKLIGVRLRYRADGPKIRWAPSLFAPELIIREAVDEAIEEVEQSMGSPRVLRGTPDSQKSE